MAELQEQLNNILGSPETMAQISRLAQSLSGGQSSPGDQQSPAEQEYIPTESESASAPENPSPDMSSLLGGLGGVDPKLVQTALLLYGEYNHAADEKKTALLAALTPFFKDERRATLEKAQRAARLAHVIRAAITLLGKEGENRV